MGLCRRCRVLHHRYHFDLALIPSYQLLPVLFLWPYPGPLPNRLPLELLLHVAVAVA
jgi:hypothetical protein